MGDRTMASRSQEKIERLLAERGLGGRVRAMPDSTRTAADAAAAVGAEVGQIAKSLVFRTRREGMPVLAVVSGANRLDEAKLAAAIGEPVERADAGYTRSVTGFVIGGVPPLGHLQAIPTYIDADLRRFGRIWAAAGTPHAVFPLTPDELVLITSGRVVALRQD